MWLLLKLYLLYKYIVHLFFPFIFNLLIVSLMQWNFNVIRTTIKGRRLIGISGSLIWSKTLMELMFNPCGKFRWNMEGPVNQIHSPHLLVGAPGIFLDLLRSVQMLKREWVQKATGSLQWRTCLWAEHWWWWWWWWCTNIVAFTVH